VQSTNRPAEFSKIEDRAPAYRVALRRAEESKEQPRQTTVSVDESGRSEERRRILHRQRCHA